MFLCNAGCSLAQSRYTKNLNPNEKTSKVSKTKQLVEKSEASGNELYQFKNIQKSYDVRNMIKRLILSVARKTPSLRCGPSLWKVQRPLRSYGFNDLGRGKISINVIYTFTICHPGKREIGMFFTKTIPTILT